MADRSICPVRVVTGKTSARLRRMNPDRPSAIFKNHCRKNTFAEIGMRNFENGAFQHAAHIIHDVFDFLGVDVVAAGNDEIYLTTHHGNTPIGMLDLGNSSTIRSTLKAVMNRTCAPARSEVFIATKGPWG
ncbi:hypothetical protein G5B39_11570 [Rhodobacteraceae bacterium SC52]|nr:hypothetical protein G5B39_11570 [Rhodobacteraceae bacterium SC52]